ncbi:MAG: aminopeptidase P family protein [Phycisphaerae bacterium]|nr:aminopeptidase P family protein [Phycisphaerae bacterium]
MAKRTMTTRSPRISSARTGAAPTAVPVTEHAARRDRVMKELGSSVAVVFAGNDQGGHFSHFRAHPHFEWLTGISDEPGAMLLLDPGNPVANRRVQLFLKPIDPELEKWDGLREEIASPLKDRYGIATIFRTNAFPRWMLDSARRAKSLTCLHPFSAHTAPVSPDLSVYREVASRIPSCAIHDGTEIIARMRATKSPTEQALMQRAIDITAEGYKAVLSTIRPGITEFEIQQAAENAYRSHGSRGPAYGTIAGTGMNGTVLHYRANSAPLVAGEVVVLDSGAQFAGYAADITRTYPVDGRFTKRQRQVYDIVLKAQLAAIAAVRPGATFAQIDEAAREVITKAGFGDFFIHGIGHHLGLEVHDIAPNEPLKAGAVLTIEPGIYLPAERFGVRIEDDILVTPSGRANLSAHIEKDADAIEREIQRRR